MSSGWMSALGASVKAATRSRPRIALDADGVLLDYNTAYAGAWKRAFGEDLAIVRPDAYSAIDLYGVPTLTGEALQTLRRAFDDTFWRTVPALPGAVEACKALAEAGHELICVTALDHQHREARLANLRDLGFPIERVVTTPATAGAVLSPKVGAVHELEPVAFVEDHAPYLRGIDPRRMHLALLMARPDGSPNVGFDRALAHTEHADLAGFARWWLHERPGT